MGLLASGHLPLGDGSIVSWAFTDRTGGMSSPPYDGANLALHVEDDPGDVADNRAALASSLGVAVEDLVTMTQVHGRAVFVVETGPSPVPPPRADALLTGALDTALVTQVADCVPVLLAGANGTIAAVHSGWRGVVAGVVDATVESLLDHGEEAGSISAWVGPAICADCYEVGADVRDRVCEVASNAFAETAQGAPAVDVRAGVRQQLARYGITAQTIDACTFEDDRLFSYRRDGRTGRQAGVIMRRTSSP